LKLDSSGQKAFISKLSLVDFRNYERATIPLHSGQNVFVGPNGQGKSNLLEAIYALSSTRSFRGARDKDLIRFSAEKAVVSGIVGEEGVDISLEYNLAGGRRASIYTQKLPRVLDLIGRLPAVVFSTTDLAIVNAGPSERRSFFDSELSLLSPSYLLAFTGYRKALDQRNAALRAVRDGASQSQLDPWEVTLAEKGALIRQARAEWLTALLPLAANELQGLSLSEESLDMRPLNADEAEGQDSLDRLLKARRAQDIAAGHTGVGPHRDDFTITLNGIEARAFASQGQRRTVALALKLAVARYWKEQLAVLPVVLLDDIMSDLDVARRNAVMAVSGSMGQVVITTTDIDAIRPEVRSDARVFEVRNGRVES
jgi:DNA replication and repair protein RecF